MRDMGLVFWEEVDILSALKSNLLSRFVSLFWLLSILLNGDPLQPSTTPFLSVALISTLISFAYLFCL